MFNENKNRKIENIYSLFMWCKNNQITNDYHLFAILFTAS